NAIDSKVRVRGIGLRIGAPGTQEWRTAMINAPIFAAATPRDFLDLLRAAGKPDAMADYVRAHPEFAPFGAWAKDGTWTGSYAEEQYNSLNSFTFTDASGVDHAVRWSIVPAAKLVAVTPDELAKGGPDVLEKEIVERVRTQGPQRWTVTVTVANPG